MLQAPDDRECASGTEQAGKAESCAGCPNAQQCASGPKGPDPDIAELVKRMETVKHKILILSGKGGVGKSTFSTQLAFAFAEEESEVGLMDVDICGPSIPRMLGLLGREIHKDATGWQPVYVTGNLGVMSVGFMLEDENAAVIWRGPKKNGLIKQFLRDVEWGELDYLLIDTPPGTSDEHLSIAQYLAHSSLDGAVILTTPQELALLDVRKEINFCKKLNIPVVGVVENMAGFVCPSCKAESQIFKPSTGGAKRMAEEMGVPFLGSIPLDPRLARACDEGKNFLSLFPDSPATLAILHCVAGVKSFLAK